MGPGADGIPGCIGDNTLVNNGAQACNQRLGVGAVGAKTDGFVATGKDDQVVTVSIGASPPIPGSKSRFGARWSAAGNCSLPSTAQPTFNQTAAFAIRDINLTANIDLIGKLNVSFCPAAGVNGDSCAPPGSAVVDTDCDGVSDSSDNCPTVPNGPGQAGIAGVGNQTDTDGDGVGDACDNCVFVVNPRVTLPQFLIDRPWATMTGDQRDDDQDGWGNVCDADFPGTPQGGNVNAADLAQFRASNGHARDALNCGSGANRRCAIFDLDLNQNTVAAPPAGNVNAADLARFRQLNGTPASVPTDKCPTCPLPCHSGTSGACP
jgi:hypothetical protein